MDLNPVQAMRKVQELSLELQFRRMTVDRQLNYFKGLTGTLPYASDKFGQYFSKRFKGFSDNWCMPVAQAPAERMNLNGIRLWGAAGRGVDKDLQRVWELNDCERGSSEAFLVFGATGRAFAMVSPNLADAQTPLITWEHPSQTIVDHDPMTRQRRFALVVWADDKVDYATLYTATQIWKFRRATGIERYQRYSPDGVNSRVDVLGGWAQRTVPGEDWPAVNPLGSVPIVELRNQTLLDEWPISDISGVMSMQDSINLVWAYLLNALDYASLPQRVVTGADVPQIPVLDKNGQEIGTRPVDLDQLVNEKILWVPDQDAKIAEWSVAQLDAFGNVIERAVEHIAAQTRTPPHYLVAKMVNTAAESLVIAEAGLVSKVKERIRYVTPAMRELYKLIAIAQGAGMDRLQAIGAGTCVWQDVQYRSEAQMADAMLKMKQVGFPFEYIAERYGLDPEEVERVMALRKKELAMDPLAAAQAAIEAANIPAGTPAAPTPGF